MFTLVPGHRLRRTIIWITTLLLVAVVAVLLLRRDVSHNPGSSDPEINTEGHFLSDSLGVNLFLPPSPGWSFRRDALEPGGSYVSALHESERCTVRLFVAPTLPTTTMDGVIKQRRAQLARSFDVDSLQQVLGRVIQEEIHEVDGYPALQWQAITRPLTMEDGKRSRVMFMWSATMRPDYIYECVAMILLPEDLLQEEQQEYDALLQDVVFIMQSFKIR